MDWLAKLSSRREPAPADPELAAKPLDSVADEFLDSYVRWREACEDVRIAYECWGNCKPPQRALGFKVESSGARVRRTRSTRLLPPSGAAPRFGALSSSKWSPPV
jgi:hypothetical protein